MSDEAAAMLFSTSTICQENSYDPDAPAAGDHAFSRRREPREEEVEVVPVRRSSRRGSAKTRVATGALLALSCSSCTSLGALLYLPGGAEAAAAAAAAATAAGSGSADGRHDRQRMYINSRKQ
ncbi:unnamed protein product, partial [Amoebophrya sp. A120]|eukprot:GSA120T00007406001.1